jgi:hypothetical protein
VSAVLLDQTTPRSGTRLLKLTLEGDWVEADVPTIDDLIKHARRFGTARVAETAAELGYQLEAVTRLITQLDVVDQEHSAEKKFGLTHFYRKPGKSAEDRAKKLLNWTDPKEEEVAAAA